MIALGTLMAGSGGALINNNCVPCLSQVLTNDIENLDVSQVKNNISAINTGAFGLGSILGPIMASLLKVSISYRWSFTLMSGLIGIVFCI